MTSDRPGFEDLGSRGRRLWAELVDDSTSESTLALIVEACRVADRLDRLDRATRADGVLDLIDVEDRDGVVEVRVGSALAEARQQGVVLRQLLVEIGRRVGESSNDDDPLDDL